MNEGQLAHFNYVTSLPYTKLGDGAFGSVTLHTDPKNGRRYVVKSVKIRNETEFQNEANILYELSKNPDTAPFVSKTKYSLIINGYGYIVQDYEDVVEGFNFVVSNEILSEKVGSELIDNLIKGVEAIHAAGYIHRDLKLENTLFKLDERGQITPWPIIIDFGFVCKIPCRSKSLVGTPGYLPQNYVPVSSRNNPDVRLFKHGKNNRTLRIKNSATLLTPDYNKKTDNYALGIMIRYLIQKIRWTNEDLINDYSIKANKLISGVIPNIAASMAKRIEYGKSVIRNTSRKRKPKRNSNNNNNDKQQPPSKRLKQNEARSFL